MSLALPAILDPRLHASAFTVEAGKITHSRFLFDRAPFIAAREEAA